MWRWLFCLALGLAAITAAQVWPLAGQTSGRVDDRFDFSDRKPVPRPPEVEGWILVRVCSITGKLDNRYTEWAYIKPEFIVAVGNPPTSPDPCVAIHGANGKRLFVSGDMAGTARYITDAGDFP